MKKVRQNNKPNIIVYLFCILSEINTLWTFIQALKRTFLQYYKLVKKKKKRQKSSPISITFKKESLDLPRDRPKQNFARIVIKIYHLSSEIHLSLACTQGGRGASQQHRLLGDAAAGGVGGLRAAYYLCRCRRGGEVNLRKQKYCFCHGNSIILGSKARKSLDKNGRGSWNLWTVKIAKIYWANHHKIGFWQECVFVFLNCKQPLCSK